MTSVGAGGIVGVGKMPGVAATVKGPGRGVVGDADPLGGWKKVGAAVGAPHGGRQAGRVHRRIKMNAVIHLDRVWNSAFI